MNAYLQNLHTHTTYCDGKDTPEEMIVAAYEKGFQSIGFSTHTYCMDQPIFSQTIDEYRKEIAALKKKYADTKLSEYGNFDIIGHFDLITKHCESEQLFDENSKEYQNLAIEAAEQLAGKIPYFEVNTGAMARRYRTTPYPQSFLLKELKRLGFGAIIFNGLVVASMMGCTISFTLPFVMGVVEKRQHRLVLIGLMCGIIAIPIGCFVAGIVAGISLPTLITDLIPLVVLAVILSIGLMRIPETCVKIFFVFGAAIKIIILIGMVIGIITFLTGYAILPYTAPIEEGALIVFHAVIVMTGAFPLLHIIGKMLRRPLATFARVSGMNDISTLGFMASLATSVTTFSMMKNMDDKGVVLNSAFAVSGAFVFAGHLAFTLSFRADFLASMIIGKLTAGIIAVVIAWFMYPVLNCSATDGE